MSMNRHNASVRLDDDDYKKLLFLHDYYNKNTYVNVSLADVLRIAIKNDYERILEEQTQLEKQKEMLDQIKEQKELSAGLENVSVSNDSDNNKDQSIEQAKIQSHGPNKIGSITQELLEQERRKAQQEKIKDDSLDVTEIILKKGNK